MRKLASSLILLFLMVSFVFILLRIAPGDPSLKYISPELSPDLVNKVKDSFGIGRPVIEQYFLYMKNVITGDLGISYTYRSTVIEVILNHLPFTVIFALIAFTIQIAVSVLLTYFSLVYKSFNDKYLTHLSIVFYSTPSFVIGVFLILIFSERLGLLPSSGIASLNNSSLSLPAKFADYFLHLILPLITVSLGGIALFYRFIRDNINELVSKNFIAIFYTCGMNRKEVIKKHLMPNAISPLLSVAGIELGVLFGGVLITEVLFGLPGMGQLTLQAVLLRDYPLATACTLVSGVFMIASNLGADLVRSKVDKRYYERGGHGI